MQELSFLCAKTKLCSIRNWHISLGASSFTVWCGTTLRHCRNASLSLSLPAMDIVDTPKARHSGPTSPQGDSGGQVLYIIIVSEGCTSIRYYEYNRYYCTCYNSPCKCTYMHESFPALRFKVQ